MTTRILQALLPASALAAGLLSLSGTASAGAIVEATYGGEILIRGGATFEGVDVPTPLDHVFVYSSTAASGPVFFSEASGDGRAGVNIAALSYVNTGGVHVSAYARSIVNTGQTRSNAWGYASGDFSDAFRINSPQAPQGTSGTATFAFSLSGGLENFYDDDGHEVNNILGGRAKSEVDAIFLVRDSQDQGVEKQVIQVSEVVNGQFWSDSNGTPVPVIFSMPVVFGDLLRMRISASVSAQANTENNYAQGFVATIDTSAHAAFEHTMAWGGIVELLDENGQAITDFTALSESTGFDYKDAYVSAVPAPAAAWLFSAGLGLIGWQGRRKKPRLDASVTGDRRAEAGP